MGAIHNCKALMLAVSPCRDAPSRVIVGLCSCSLRAAANGRPGRTRKEIPASTQESDAMSKDLKKRGFRFVGSTICYAFMQATGMVNDHLVTCYRYRELQ
jgi:3-methyladenine DNA glycosylase Tag